MPLRDKCCQTDHHHHGCCEPALEPGDPPLLRQPLYTSKSGIQQIIECFRSGTKQLKHILLKDVDTIFECKLCRSLFRGLPNLITHKKFYCPPSFRMDDKIRMYMKLLENNSKMSDSFSVDLQSNPKQHFTTDDPPDANDKQCKAISGLLEARYPRMDNQDYVIQLEPIGTNQNAVFQYVSKADSSVESIEMNVTPEQASVEMSEPSMEPPKAFSASSGAETVQIAPLAAAKIIVTPEEPTPPSKPEPECGNNSDSGHQLICCLCKKEFHSRRSVRRHIRKVHKKKMEELKKFIEIKKKLIQTSRRGRNKNVLVALGRSCPVCFKSFATKANVRRHFDEVHRGLRRDSITPDIATKPGQPLSLDSSSAKKPLKPRKQKSSSKAEYNLTTCKCLLCKRKYSSQVMLKRHMQIVHKITLSTKNAKREKKPNNTSKTEAKVKIEPAESSESAPPIVSPLQNGTKGTSNSNEKKSELSTEKKNKVSVERKNKISVERKNKISVERKNKISVERKNKVSVERKNKLPVERTNKLNMESKSKVSMERKNRVSVERKNKVSVERNNKVSMERKNKVSTERKNMERKSVVSMERKNMERKNMISTERKTLPSTEKKSLTSAERKSASSTERKNVSSIVRKNTPSTQKNKVKKASENSKSSNQSIAGGPKKPRKPRLSAGFDFRKLYCKLCKRQFTSKQNLTKHIELHTDGNNIYVKFYKCPLCTYETRRKRDVVRHIAVVHKKSSHYLCKITASLEMRAIKKPIDSVLKKVSKRGPQRDEGKQISSKQDVTSNSPSKKYEGTDVGIEVKVTKNFSLHRCNKCGKAFARKTFLEHHKKTHKANASHSPEENKTKGRSTRSKALVW